MNPYPEQGFELQTQNSSNPNQYPEVPPPQCYGQAQPVYPVYPQMPVSGVTYIPQPQSIITNQIVINPTPELRSDSTLMICPFCKIYINTAVNKSVSCCNVLCFVCTSPVLWAAFQLVRGKDLVCLDAKHRCPNCGANVGTYTAC